MEAMDKIGYQAVGLGLHEMELPLLTALAEYALNFPTPPGDRHQPAEPPRSLP